VYVSGVCTAVSEWCCVLQDCRGRVAELFGVSAEDIAVKHLEEFPGRALVLVCVDCACSLCQWCCNSASVVVGESSVDGSVPDDTHAQTGV